MSPPVFMDDEAETQRAGLLHLVILISLGFTTLSLLAILVGHSVPNRTLIIVLTWLALLFQTLRWLRDRKLARVEWMLTVGFFIAITSVNISQGTVRAPATAIYVFWVTLAVTIYRLPGLLLAAGISSMAVLGLIIAENSGMLPKPDLSVGLTQWVVLTGLFLMTATLAHYTNQLTQKALKQSRNENEQRIQAEAALRKLTRAVEQSPNSIVITDLKGTIEYVNPRFSSVTGYSLEEVIGKNPRILKTGETPPETYHQMWEALSSGREWRGEFVNHKKDGTRYFESAIISPVTDSYGVPTHYLAVKEDVTDRKRAEEALRLSEERHRLIANFASDVVWTMSPDGRITYISPSIEAVRGFTPDEAMRQPIEDIHTPASLEASLNYFVELHADIQAGRPPKTFRGEMEYRCKDGSTVWTEVMVQPVLGKDGAVIEILGVTRSIAEHKRLLHELQAANEAAERANAELHRIATTDALTGVSNRRQFEQVATTARDQAVRYKHPVSMLLFDIDHFKHVNDLYGHQIGDQVLIELTRVVSQVIRGTDLLARWGGEEFVVIMSHCTASDAMQLAEKIRRVVADHPFPEVGKVTISLGVAELDTSETLDDWFGRVDQALFQAKAEGRNTVRLSGSRAE